MNTIEKINENEYLLTIEDGRKFPCKTWIEKKVKDGNPIEYEHVIIPKEVREICGRTYIRTSLINGRYEFETKTTHREGIGSGSWKDRMTDEEKEEYLALEKRMNEIKEAAMNRRMTEEEKLLREIEKLKKKLSEVKNHQ